ncbi:hypothetical protein [Gottschalkia purinilytica]|nr:hypothetical protein [Gottschalkia purinilytica]
MSKEKIKLNVAEKILFTIVVAGITSVALIPCLYVLILIKRLVG